MGIDLNRFTILAGAFGVGIGFGMQNIINNFVSGIILLFERPIQVGDTVQLGEIVGEVKRIGIRSSAIRTLQGAEVIVPNASFISETVTNWTLSDRLRRIDVNIGVAYGSDPERVLQLLRDVAANHPLVLTEPPAVALFIGFGESSLDFELRAWTGRFDEWPRIRSEINIAVNATMRDAGIVIPFPQRRVQLDPLKPVDVRILEK
jgi:small-conductance mechanosensitive channel